jgi:hypothetical protein
MVPIWICWENESPKSMVSRISKAICRF